MPVTELPSSEQAFFSEPLTEPGARFVAARDSYRAEVTKSFKNGPSSEARLKIVHEKQLSTHAAQAVYEYILKCQSAGDFEESEINKIFEDVLAGDTNSRMRPIFNAAAEELTQANRAVRRAAEEFPQAEHLLQAGYGVVPEGGGRSYLPANCDTYTVF